MAKKNNRVVHTPHRLTPAESAKGRVKAKEVLRTRKTFKEIFEVALSLKAPQLLVPQLKKMYPDLSERELNMKSVLALSLMNRVINVKSRDATKAFELIRDTIGEKPQDKLELSGIPESSNVMIYIPEKQKDA